MAYIRSAPVSHPLRVYVGKNGALQIAAAKPTTPEAHRFSADNPEELFETLKEAGLPVSSANFWIAGVTPAITKMIAEKREGKLTGEQIEAGAAYSAEQIAAASPKGFSLQYTYKGKFPRLLLSCYSMSRDEYLASQGQTTSGGVTHLSPRKAAEHAPAAVKTTTARTRRIGQE